MAIFQIEGGKKLSGVVQINTSKNSAVALICASLLNSGKTTLKQMPRIEEVNRLIEVLLSIGVSVSWSENNDLIIIPPKNLNLKNINTESALKTRSIIIFIGPLIHLFKTFYIPRAGGCALGKRTVRPHFFALERLGVKIETVKEAYKITSKALKNAEIVLYESGDTVTINTLLAAAKIKGKTTIKLASANYQVQDICLFLKKIGLHVEGIGTTTITIYGTPRINKTVVYYPSEDPIEAMLFLAIAATTNSSITIKRCPIDFLELELLKLEKMNFKYKILKRYKSKNNVTNLIDLKTNQSKLEALEEKIYARPFPGLNIDNLPFFVPIATQAKGQTLIHDWVFENRAIYYLELTKLGADIILADPHRVYINGPTKLKAAEVICPPALRPAAIIMIAMLAAKGTSLLRNVYSINRGYEDLSRRLKKLGARIEILEK
ncbi:MAG: UDP-N-acetylglucosamine 1-carboxyvinyltransferase [Patescibacteria group bacterium]|nr:UDP-N-acetylglucosamine 1-carboxyvinyltransferase [Patescibacteria group bacterium]